MVKVDDTSGVEKLLSSHLACGTDGLNTKGFSVGGCDFPIETDQLE